MRVLILKKHELFNKIRDEVVNDENATWNEIQILPQLELTDDWWLFLPLKHLISFLCSGREVREISRNL